MVLRLLRILIWSWAESKQEYGVFLFPSLEFSRNFLSHVMIMNVLSLFFCGLWAFSFLF